MAYKDILVQADAGEASARRSRIAARLARQFNAELTGVFLRTTFPIQSFTAGPYGVVPPIVTPKLIAEYEDVMDAAAAGARASFEAAVREAGVPSEWLTVDGDTPRAMLQCMRRTDLTVFPRDLLPTVREYGLTPAQLGMWGGGPMLVLPDVAADQPIGRRVLVAWNDSREAARALRDAWPLLATAEEVVVLIVSAQGDVGPEGMLRRHFEHHGCKAKVMVEQSPEASIGEVILRQAAGLNADLVVMGLYGHARLQELLLGGVSRDLLKASPTALLVSH